MLKTGDVDIRYTVPQSYTEGLLALLANGSPVSCQISVSHLHERNNA
jgi:hypothetical protein